MRYAAAAVQYEPTLGEKQRNLLHLTDLVRKAAATGARLVVCPEMATTGYRFQSAAEIALLVEHVPDGPTTTHFLQLTRDLGIHLVVGLPELDPTTGNRYNTAVLLGPDGFIGKYRKVHLYEDDLVWASEGDLGFPVFDTPLGQIAMLICMDLVFMEAAREVALAGADIIAAPVNWSASPITWWARALENGVYLICANRWDEERGATYAGRSAIINPLGKTLSTLDSGDGIASSDIDTDLVHTYRTAALARRLPTRYASAWTGRQTPIEHDPNCCHIWVAAGQGRTASEMADQIVRAASAADEGTPHLNLMVFPLCHVTDADSDMHVLRAAAERTGYHVVWGSCKGNKHAWLLRPDGQAHRHFASDLAAASAAVFDLPWGRLGIALGEDLLDPEVVRCLAFTGADVVAVPADWQDDSTRWVWAVRWMENEIPVVVANRSGGSRIWHSGRPRPEAGSGYDSIINATVVIGEEKTGLTYLRPSWYTALVSL